MRQENSPRKFTTELTLFVVMHIENRTNYPMLVDIFFKDGHVRQVNTLIYLKEAVYKALPVSEHG